MATLCATGTRKTSTMGSKTAASVTPPSTVKRQPKNICLGDLTRAPLSKRLLYQRIDTPSDAHGWTKPHMYLPCLYSRNVDVMLEELGAMHDEYVKRGGDGEIFFSEDTLDGLVSQFQETEDFAEAEARNEDPKETIPVVVLLVFNDLIPNPSGDNFFRHPGLIMEVSKQGSVIPDHAELFEMARWIGDYAKPKQKTVSALERANQHRTNRKRKGHASCSGGIEKRNLLQEMGGVVPEVAKKPAAETEQTAPSTAKRPRTTQPEARAAQASTGGASMLAAAQTLEKRAPTPVTAKESQVETAASEHTPVKKPLPSDVSTKPADAKARPSDASTEPTAMEVEQQEPAASMMVVDHPEPQAATQKADDAAKACKILQMDILDGSYKATDARGSVLPLDDIRRCRGGAEIHELAANSTTASVVSEENTPEQQEAQDPQPARLPEATETPPPQPTTTAKQTVQVQKVKSAAATTETVADGNGRAAGDTPPVNPTAERTVPTETTVSELSGDASQHATKPIGEDNGRGEKMKNVDASEKTTADVTQPMQVEALHPATPPLPAAETLGKGSGTGYVYVEETQVPVPTKTTTEEQQRRLSTSSALPPLDSPEMDKPLVVEQPPKSTAKKPSARAAEGKKRKKESEGKPPLPKGRTPAKVGRPVASKKGHDVGRRSPSPYTVNNVVEVNGVVCRTLTDEERKIPTFHDVRPTLKKFGCSFDTEKGGIKYCYPKKPETSSDEMNEGFTYSLEEFRKALCKNGLGQSQKPIPEKDLSKVERWVRLAIVSDLPPEATLLPETIPFDLPGKILRKLGYNFHTHQLKGEPDTRIYTQADLVKVLSYDGLNSKCYFENITPEDRQQLELFIAFSERSLYEAFPRPEGRGRRRGSRAQSAEVPKATPLTKKKAPAKKQKTARTPAPAAIPMPVANTPMAGNIVRPTPLRLRAATTPVATSTKVAAPPKGLIQNCSPVGCDNVALAACNSNPVDGTVTDIPAETAQNTNENTQQAQAFADLDVTKATATDGKAIVLGGPGTHYQRNTERVLSLLQGFVQSRMNDELDDCSIEKPASMLVCGSPGIGKTTAVDYCCEHVKKSFSETGVKPVVVSINCKSFGTGGDVLAAAKQKIWEDCKAYSSLPCMDTALERVLTWTGRKDNRRFVILVLDEIDQLLHPDSDSEKAKNSNEKLIEAFSDWASLPSHRFALIGIGNTMSGTKFRRLRTFLGLKNPDFNNHTITFRAFREHDLVKILESRLVDRSAVDPKALTFIAKKCGASSGDARPALEALNKALADAKERVAKHGRKPTDDYIVKVRDAVRATSANFARLPNQIEELPYYGKLVVAAAADLALNNSRSEATVTVTRGDLLRSTRVAYGENSHFDFSDFNAQVSTLHDLGLAQIKIGISGHPSDDTIVFNCMPDELDAAVDEVMGKDRPKLQN